MPTTQPSWALGWALGTALGAQPGRACARRLGVLAGQLGQVGALCTWLSFDSVFDRFDSELFLSHEMNTVHCKIKKKIF